MAVRNSTRNVAIYLFLALACRVNVCVAQNTTDPTPDVPTTCPVSSPPPDEKVDDPVCSLCPDGMVADPEMANVRPLQEYASQIAAALAQAGQSELIPTVLSFVTCGCEQLDYLFSSAMLNDMVAGIEGGEETCSMFQMFLGSGDFPGGPEGCCMSSDDSSDGYMVNTWLTHRITLALTLVVLVVLLEP